MIGSTAFADHTASRTRQNRSLVHGGAQRINGPVLIDPDRTPGGNRGTRRAYACDARKGIGGLPGLKRPLRKTRDQNKP